MSKNSLPATRGAQPPVLGAQRIVAIHPEALQDLLDGYLHVVTQLHEQWQVGLISAASTSTEDLLLAQQGAAEGVDILRLESCHFLTLIHERSNSQHWYGVSIPHPSGTRYFVTVMAVDEGNDFYDDED